MPQNTNPWDILSSNFNTHLKESEIDPAAADNIVISWPPIFKCIRQQYEAVSSVRILDFGCGTGGFSKELTQLGFDVVGVDSSQKMISIARKYSSKNIKFIVGDHKVLSSLGKFHIIVSQMTLQFIKEIDTTISQLASSLKDNGLLIFSVFNIEWVIACLKANTPFSFSGFVSVESPTTGFIEFKRGIKVPVYNKTVQEYDRKITKHGLKKIMEEYPPFTHEFIKKYSYTKPSQVSEFMILGYQKEG